MSAGSVIIVTGASAGIGAAIVDKLLQQDAKVVLVDIAEEPLKNRQAKHGDESVKYVVGDVSKDETNFQAIKVAMDTWGKLDALALNAGIMAPVKRVCDVASSEWTRIFNINVVSQISMVRMCFYKTNGNTPRLTKTFTAYSGNPSPQEVKGQSHLHLF